MSGWSRDQVLKLIEIVRDRPSLYDYKHPWYKSRNARQQMLIECQEALQFIRPNTSIDEIKKKWSAIRQTYLLEKKKEENSLKIGLGKDLVCSPSLFYYKEMEFLNNFFETRTPEVAYNLEEEIDSLQGTFGISPEGRFSREDSSCSNSEPPTPSSKRRKRALSRGDSGSSPSRVSDALLSVSSSLLSSCSTERPEDCEDRYVKTVADRLRAFSERERTIIKKKIDDMLYEAYIQYKRGSYIYFILFFLNLILYFQ